MKVGILTASISRQSGGLYWAIRPLAIGIKNSGYEVKVFSISDRYSDYDLAQWKGIDVSLQVHWGPQALGYAPGLVQALNDAELNLIHTHGVWMYPSVAAIHWSGQQKRPYIVSPHGMLDAWALKNSAWKKYIAGMLFEKAHLRRAACLHALCESEYLSIRNYGLKNPVAIIPNGIDLPDQKNLDLQPDWSLELPQGSRVLLFLGRIHLKKGISNLLHSWARVRQNVPEKTAAWRLVIAGWSQGGHQEELEHLVKELNIDESVHFVGPQFDNQKVASLHHADAFVLPSFSEGLPMSVLEAWSHGLPVLMTQQCNIPEGFESQSALEMVPETDSIAVALERLFNMSETERQSMGERGRKLVESRFAWKKVAADMCSMYEWVLGQGPKPSCVITD